MPSIPATSLFFNPWLAQFSRLATHHTLCTFLWHLSGSNDQPESRETRRFLPPDDKSAADSFISNVLINIPDFFQVTSEGLVCGPDSAVNVFSKLKSLVTHFQWRV